MSFCRDRDCECVPVCYFTYEKRVANLEKQLVEERAKLEMIAIQLPGSGQVADINESLSDLLGKVSDYRSRQGGIKTLIKDTHELLEFSKSWMPNSQGWDSDEEIGPKWQEIYDRTHKLTNLSSKDWYIYIVKCSDQTYYTGASTDVAKRIDAHNKSKGAKYTKARLPVALVYSEKIGSKSDALKKEYQIKQLSRTEKEKLIASYNSGNGTTSSEN